MVVEFQQTGERTVAALRLERLDASVAGAFKQALTSEVDAGARVMVIDLSEVKFIDSSGLGALVSVLKRMGSQGSIELSGVGIGVLKVLELTRMTEVFTIRERLAAG